MQGLSSVKCICLFLCAALFITEVAIAAPAPEDEDVAGAGELYELLMQKKAIEDKIGQFRRTGQQSQPPPMQPPPMYPSLRLRYGRRSDPRMSMDLSYLMEQARHHYYGDN